MFPASKRKLEFEHMSTTGGNGTHKYVINKEKGISLTAQTFEHGQTKFYLQQQGNLIILSSAEFSLICDLQVMMIDEVISGCLEKAASVCVQSTPKIKHDKLDTPSCGPQAVMTGGTRNDSNSGSEDSWSPYNFPFYSKEVGMFWPITPDSYPGDMWKCNQQGIWIKKNDECTVVNTACNGPPGSFHRSGKLL